MTVVSRAPGKLVVLGEYAVIAGGPALVMAVDRRCRVAIGPSADEWCRLRTRTAKASESRFAPDAPSGVELVDRIRGRWPGSRGVAWTAEIDTGPLHGRAGKLGLGSSAAALTAFAGAWAEHTGRSPPTPRDLIELHRAWQSGAGSGLDVAASRLGGVSRFRLCPGGETDIVSVPLPEGVGFVGVFPGRAASTPDLLSRFAAWRARTPKAASARLEMMIETAEQGIAAARTGAADEFLAAVARYADLLEALGRVVGTDLVTPEHRRIARVAARSGVTYKISGAGGGDMGLGLACDPQALDSFVAALPAGSQAVRLRIDEQGLVVEERSV